ncbi:acyltransferase [Streptomyces sp. NBC_01498]|uniref:acyltransferase family protein n=1 Tax=Streptomyces sp. NBC_01498 TaxID=2975870 RepID=UPI002E7B9CA1|nr:acyltransferase [Streptomyces sp. NBC_01498]WTL23869.1 acyltransferase [Streptomyces sp. NBC_01498]
MRASSPRQPSATPDRSGLSGRDRLPSLTGLRFWAALIVVLYHLSRQVGEIPGLSQATWYGRSGVTFFFVLSGFVLAWTYDGQRVPATVFLWRRFARIWPLLVVTSAASVAVWIAIGKEVSTKAVLATLLMVHAWVADPVIQKGANPAAWSLSDEAWFYLVFPLLMLLPALRSGRGRFWTAVTMCVALVLVWFASALIDTGATRVWLLDYFPPTRMLQFVVGVAAGLAVKRGWRPPVALPAAIGLVALWHLALIPWHAAVPDSLWYSPYSASQLLSAPIFALLVCAAAQADLAGGRTGLGGTWSVRLGHWSFAWYLVHEIVIRALLARFGRTETLATTAGFWLLAIVISLALAGMAYQWVEHPLERLLRRAGPQARKPGSPLDSARPGAAAGTAGPATSTSITGPERGGPRG